MSTVAWIIISVLVLALVGVAIAWSRTRGAAHQTTATLETTTKALEESRRSTEHLETRMRTLRAELAESHRSNADLTARIGRTNPVDASRALGMWALERLRQARAAGTPLLGLAIGPGMDLTSGLTEAIRVELEVLREEVGTHAELIAIDLGDGIDARGALTVLRIVQELAATLAKRADELTVSITREDDLAVITVAAVGSNDASPNVAAFESAIAALEGTLELRPHPEDADTLLAIARFGTGDSS